MVEDLSVISKLTKYFFQDQSNLLTTPQFFSQLAMFHLILFNEKHINSKFSYRMQSTNSLSHKKSLLNLKDSLKEFDLNS